LLPFFESHSSIEVYDKLISYWYDPSQLLKNHKPIHLYNKTSQLPLIQEMMYRDTKNYLPGDILTKVDRASMAVSLEVRSPFLDYHVIEQAWQLPIQMKLRGSQGKIVLKELLSCYVPDSLFERPKMGFGVPMAEWLRGPLRDWADSLLCQTSIEKSDVFHPELIQRYWGEHLSGQRNWQYPLWTILMFQEWSQQYRG
jgi:asparagine synthase (glutamine-hydrolysing)